MNDILKGYTHEDGTREPSVQEKIARGKKRDCCPENLSRNQGARPAPYLKGKHEILRIWLHQGRQGTGTEHPNLLLRASRLMVGVGSLLILFFALSLFLVYKKEIAQYRWFLISAIIMIPLAYIASESGWIVAEIGRQPWTIQDLLPVSAAISDIEAGSVATTFFIFLTLFTTMLAVEISILVKQIKKGPEYE